MAEFFISTPDFTVDALLERIETLEQSVAELEGMVNWLLKHTSSITIPSTTPSMNAIKRRIDSSRIREA
jgi:hypothetical protein